MKRRILALATVFALILGLSACGKGGFALNETKKILKIGESFQLEAGDGDITWITSDADVVSVESGMITGLMEGSADVTAVLGDKRATCKVMVENSYFPTLTILGKVDTLFLGGTYDMEAEVMLGGKTASAEVKWSSSDESVVKFDADGKLTVVGEGKATITATATYEGNELRDTMDILASGLSYIDAPTKLSLGMYAGDKSSRLNYKIYLDGKASGESATITSADPSIAKVAGNTVTGVGEGETTLTLTYETDKYSMSAEVTVTVSRHILHTFTKDNTSYYTGDLPRSGGKTNVSMWFSHRPTATTNNSLGGENGTGFRVWAYYYDPGLSFPMELTKQQLQNYRQRGYSKIVIPVYSNSEYANNFQITCCDYVSKEIPTGAWTEVEFPLAAFIENYDRFTVEGTPMITFPHNWYAVIPGNVGGQEVEFYIYFGDIFLR